MDLRLGDLLGKYKEDLKRQDERKHSFWSKAYKPVKPLSLYVLTDGTWPNCNAVRPIEDMILFGRPKEQVGIQFVRFGNRPIGIKRLKYLDSGLRKKHGRDRYVQKESRVPSGLFTNFVFVVILLIRNPSKMAMCSRCFLGRSRIILMTTTTMRILISLRHREMTYFIWLTKSNTSYLNDDFTILENDVPNGWSSYPISHIFFDGDLSRLRLSRHRMQCSVLIFTSHENPGNWFPSDYGA